MGRGFRIHSSRFCHCRKPVSLSSSDMRFWWCICGLAFLIFLPDAPGQTDSGLRPWTDYRTIMWIGDSAGKRPEQFPLFLQRLREMGINTAMVDSDSDPAPFVESKFPYYVENIVNRGLCLKWNSKVRDWDGFVTRWAKDGRPESALVRDYCLNDPKWLDWATGEMQRVVTRNAPNNPLAYNIRDELSTTLSANPFDYDFSPVALNKFRDWLRTQYQGIDALNAEWETNFKTWDEVRPFTTDEIKNRMSSAEALPRGKPDWQAVEQLKFDPSEAHKNPTLWNFSPWCDFRTFMDISLADALSGIRRAAQEIDPRTPVGIEGAQAASAFGGYDLSRLARTLDWIEPYDVGNAREILGSFMPGKPMLTTVFESDANHARRRLWHLLLEGDRGCIVWWSEDCIDWKSADYALTPKALALAPVLAEMQSPLARAFIGAQREYDPIAIHYSQSSIQADWLIESCEDGSTWLRRFSSYESNHNRLMQLRDSWLKAFQDLGYTPRFVSTEQIENGELTHGIRVLVMPQSLALSDAEEREITNFLANTPPAPCFVFSDSTPGLFDAHGKFRGGGAGQLPFPDQAPGQSAMVRSSAASATESSQPGDIAGYARERLAGVPSTVWPEFIADHFSNTDISPPIAVPPESRTRIYRYKFGAGRLIAFERGVDYLMSEDLKQAGGNAALEQPIALEAKLDKPAHVYDLRAQKYLGLTDHIAFTLDPWQPSLFAVMPDEIPIEQLPH